MANLSYNLESAIIGILVIVGFTLLIWSKISGKKIMQLIKEVLGNE